MTEAPPEIVIQGDLHISSPTDEFILRGDENELSLIGPSLRSFLRLRRQASAAVLPAWVKTVGERLTGRSSFVLRCRCRGRHIATVISDADGVSTRSNFGQILGAALRI